MTTLTLNAKLNGIELRFEEKPAESIRTAMKDLGFRWSQKQSMWWAKQSEARLALAKSLADNITEEPKTEEKPKAKKSTKKAEPKEQPKAEEPKAEKPKTVKLSELSEKVTFDIAEGKKFSTRKGYTFTATMGRKKLQLGVAKEKDNTWNITELTTGLSLTTGAEKRYLALNTVDAELFEKAYEALKNDKNKKLAKKMADHKASK